MHRKLFIPGPTEVRDEILKEMAKPLIGHRSKDFSELFLSTVSKLKKVFYTENKIFISSSSGTGLMEATIRNCVSERCLNLICGHFGEEWYKIALSNGKNADCVRVEPGDGITPESVREKLDSGSYDAICLTHNETSTGVMNPIYEIAEVINRYEDVLFMVDSVSSLGGVKIEVDKLGIDVCLTSSQKCLAIPPGIAVCSVSERALERSKKVRNRGYYFDFQTFLKFYEKSQTISTPPISQIYALNKELDYILEEGLENRFNRHKTMAEYTRKWALEHFDMFPKERFWSNTLTVIKNTKGIKVDELNKKLAERNMQISNGYGELKEKTFRIAHMGDLQLEDMKELIMIINEILGL